MSDDWFKKKLEKIWQQKEVEKPCSKTSWRIRNGITPVSRRVKSNRRYQAVVKQKEKTAEEILNEFFEMGKFDS